MNKCRLLESSFLSIILTNSIGGIASTVFSKELEQKAEAAGLFAFTQTEEGGASIANSPDFTPVFY